jgi:hypothetical protein
MRTVQVTKLAVAFTSLALFIVRMSKYLPEHFKILQHTNTYNMLWYSHAIEWLQTGFGLAIGFTEHLQIVTTSNYSTLANYYYYNYFLDLNIMRYFWSGISSPITSCWTRVIRWINFNKAIHSSYLCSKISVKRWSVCSFPGPLLGKNLLQYTHSTNDLIYFVLLKEVGILLINSQTDSSGHSLSEVHSGKNFITFITAFIRTCSYHDSV